MGMESLKMYRKEDSLRYIFLLIHTKMNLFILQLQDIIFT